MTAQRRPSSGGAGSLERHAHPGQRVDAERRETAYLRVLLVGQVLDAGPQIDRLDERVTLEEPVRGARVHRRVAAVPQDRKSTRLNSSHANISYAVFCLKKKKASD